MNSDKIKNSIQSPRNVILLSVDRLRPSQIGAYGNTTHETENFDRLAAESILFDRAFSLAEDLESSYDLLFSQAVDSENWLPLIRDAGIETTFLADRESRLDAPSVSGFDQVRPIFSKPLDRLANRVSQTQLARYFAGALDWVEQMPPGSLGWFDCSGLAGQWDAPYELRQNLAIEDDPDPPEIYQPPHFWFDVATDDPDVLLGLQHALTAQVQMLDQFIGILLDVLEEPRFQSTMFCLVSPRGYPLGEHGVIGQPADPSAGSNAPSLKNNFNESLHVPMMIRLPEIDFPECRLIRSGRMAQPSSLIPLITSFLTGNDPEVDAWVKNYAQTLPQMYREVVVVDNAPEISIQTHAWKLIQNTRTGDCQLFAKPDDLWEVNDVSSRCPHVMASLQQLLQEIKSNPAIIDDPSFRLPADLVTGHS
jgi:hypothetical protein